MQDKHIDQLTLPRARKQKNTEEQVKSQHETQGSKNKKAKQNKNNTKSTALEQSVAYTAGAEAMTEAEGEVGYP